VKFVKDKHGLSLSPFNINDGVTTFAVGFDIAEDAYFTKFLLMQ
jgi:GH24 family phage-related lysozyme (muramidase)